MSSIRHNKIGSVATRLRVVSLPEIKRTRRDPLRRFVPVGTVPAVEERESGGDPSGPANSGITDTNVVYHGGAIADGLSVVLIYWGSAWITATSPTLGDFDVAARGLVQGPFPSQLEQYGVGRPWIKESILVIAPEAPGYFNKTTVEEMVSGLIEKEFPEPDEAGGKNYYCVVMPIGSIYDEGGLSGSHWWPDTGWFLDPDTAWLGWIGNGRLDIMTRAFGHELVEVCTDPEGDGWYVDSLGHEGEIGDVCNKLWGTVDGVAAEYYWSNEANACVLPTTIQTFAQTTTIAAVARPWSQVDVFAVETGGGVYTVWQRDGTWHNWRRVGDGGFAQHTPVVAVSKAPAQIDLFAVGDPDSLDGFGGIYTAWWNPDDGWQGWSTVGSGAFAQRTPVAAVTKNIDQIDLFAVGGPDGADGFGGVYTAWWNAAEDWHGWSRVGSGSFAQQTPVVALSKNPGQIDLFAVGGPDGSDGLGGVYTAWWNAAEGWHGWSRVGSGAFAQQTPIAAVSKNAGQIDLFAVGGPDGADGFGGVYTAWWNAAEGWHGWSRVGSGAFAQQTPVAAVSKNPGEIDLFAVGGDGRVYTAWWNGTWNDWTCVL